MPLMKKFLVADDNRAGCKVLASVLDGSHVYCFPPSEILERNFWTLVSMGMSGTKMDVPGDIDDAEYYQHAEVMCYLPAIWQIPSTSGVGNITEYDWPIEMLRSLARYVSSTRCWVAEDHGIPSMVTDTPGAPFHSSTKLANVILLDPVEEDEEFRTVYVGGEVVRFYLVVPLTPAEAQWKREVGAANSIHYIVGNKREYPENVLVDYIIDASRQCVVEDLCCREYYDNLSEQDDDEDNDNEVDDNNIDSEAGNIPLQSNDYEMEDE